MQLLSFDDAIEQTKHQKRHLLLGNGFSIALFPNRFTYGSLLESADFTNTPEARQAFDVLNTSDFEEVINILKQAANVSRLYGVDSVTSAKMVLQAETLKDLLVQAIAGRHPEFPSEVSEAQFSACRQFLSHFRGKREINGRDGRGHIYTLNYDLLLYWTLLHTAGPQPDDLGLDHDDGFRAPLEEPDAPYVTWDGERSASPSLHFLHGALHLFDHEGDLRKLCWERSGGRRLVDQIREALDGDLFPLFVSEGSSRSKLKRIRHSAYLHKGLRSFAEICRQKAATLFIFGHSLAPSDNHILREVERGAIQNLYVSMYGEPESATNRTLVARAEQLARQRPTARPITLHFFDSKSARVWN